MVLLIISQYRYSRHFFIVEHNEATFRRQAKALIEELEPYKRDKDVNRPIAYGDIDSEYYKLGCHRYNVNDWGDIYFIIKPTATHCLHEIKGYWDDSRRESRGYQKRSTVESIFNHHDFKVVSEIVKRNFNLI